MSTKRLIAMFLVVVMLGSGIPPAYAHRDRDASPHPAIIAVAAVFGLAIVAGLITWLSKRSAKTAPNPLMPMTSPFDEGQSQGGKMHYGLQCRQTAAEELTLTCW